MAENKAFLDIQGLTIQYETDNGVVHAVENLNLSVGKGESLGLVGESGAGKTTTALGVLRLIPNPPGVVKSGKIFLDGENLMEKSEAEMRQIRGARIAMIFQDPMTSLNPVITVDHQIAEMIKLHKNVTEAESLKMAGDMLEKVGLKRERMHDYPHQFSGGQKQRVVIAIALACDPELLIADEPTTALDVTIQAQVLDMMKTLKKERSGSMILITHDLGVVADICDKVAIMYAGRIVEYGDKRSMYLNPVHPYTIGLFASVPNLDEDVPELKTIPGQMPDPMELPNGCMFHPRCEHATAACREKEPAMVEVEPGHFVACPVRTASMKKGGAH